MNPGAILVKEYEIIRTIGSGGMGDVYQARQLRNGQYVAIKILREDLIKDREAVTRFRREARAAAALKSPHAARIFTVGEMENQQPFIVMEYLEGWDLMTEIDTRGALPVSEAVSYVAQACHAMIEAHELGIVHRDLKPPNLFLAREGGRRVVKVLDFGISKVTQLTDGHVTSTQMSFGSPLYMSPEQIRSTKLVDGRSDVWSLGVILYESLVGEPPFMGESAGALAVVISVEPHTPASQKRPGLPPGLDEIIAGALQKDPKKRYASVKEFLRALDDFLPHDETGASTTRIQPPQTEPSNGTATTDQSAPTQPHPYDLMKTPAYQQAAPPPPFGPHAAPSLTVHGTSAMAAVGPQFVPDNVAPDNAQGPKTMVMPPRITLGPATTDPPVSPSQTKERIGLILAAFLIPLGAIAFGFAIWLYAKGDRNGSRHHASQTSATVTASSVATTPPPTAETTISTAVASIPSVQTSSAQTAKPTTTTGATQSSTLKGGRRVPKVRVTNAPPHHPPPPPPPTRVLPQIP